MRSDRSSYCVVSPALRRLAVTELSLSRVNRIRVTLRGPMSVTHDVCGSRQLDVRRCVLKVDLQSAIAREVDRQMKSQTRKVFLGPILGLGVLLSASVAMADATTQAKRLHDRLAGVPPSSATLTQMSNLIASNDKLGAARIAMQAPTFYNTTLKNWITPWTNRDLTVFAPLNDYTATVIGMIRDDVPFNTVLSGDVLYVGGAGLPAYSPTSNALYEQMEDSDLNLADPAVLVASTQSANTGLPAAATAGVMTTRAASKAFFVAGTNRAMLRFTLMNHLCQDLEQLQDVELPTDRIRQDVSRSPGGDSRMFLNNCVGCHSGMDPLAQAFAHYNYDEAAGRTQYTPAVVDPKYLINKDNFRQGYVTGNDGWSNYWRSGVNRKLGWSGTLPGSGNGAKSMGQELAGSQQFARCQVEKVFRTVCLRPPVNGADRGQIDRITALFQGNGYRMKEVFAEAAAYCIGE